MKKILTKIICSVPRQFSPGLKLCFGFILIAMLQASVTAQTPAVKISGKIITAAGQPLEGVTVGEKNAINMTTTDVNGSFTLVVPGDAVLVITYVGFKKQEVSVAGKTQLLIELEVAFEGLPAELKTVFKPLDH